MSITWFGFINVTTHTHNLCRWGHKVKSTDKYQRIENEAQVGSIIVGNGYTIDGYGIGIGRSDNCQWLV